LLDALVLFAAVTLARGFREADIDDAAFLGDDAFGLQYLAEGLEEFASAFASSCLDALLEIPERFGIRDVIADAQAEEGFEAGAVNDLLLGGITKTALPGCARGRVFLIAQGRGAELGFRPVPFHPLHEQESIRQKETSCESHS
jgi:hypothetical protein